jgi:hypothetical protein
MPDDINTDEKKDMFLNGLNDDIQFQLLNTDYADFQHMVDKAIIVKEEGAILWTILWKQC